MSILPLSFTDYKGYSYLGPRENALSCIRFITRRYVVIALVFITMSSLLFRMYWYDNIPSGLFGDVPDPVEPLGETSTSPNEVPVVVMAPAPPLDPLMTEDPRWPGRRLPPLYPEWHQRDLALPQHHWHASPDDSEPKFFFVPGHTTNSGWGNYFEELIMNAHLAYRLKRSFVFYNHTWNMDGSLYSDYNGKPIPSQIPLSAILRGPIVGDPFPTSVEAFPAVKEEYFEEVCRDRKSIHLRNHIHDTFRSNVLHDTTEGWVKYMANVDDQCVEVGIDSGVGVIFHYTMFGEAKGVEGIWNELSKSPVITHFGWSPIVELAFDNNIELISPSHIASPPLSSLPFTSNAERYTELPGLLVLHVRRGDYKEHCINLATYSSRFTAFNTLPGLEHFEPPPTNEDGSPTEEGMALYLERCWPSFERIVAKVEAARAAETEAGRAPLDRIYIMTNGAVEWVAELKAALAATGHFKHITSSKDLVLNWEQKYVAQAVDQLIGQRAQVFIGNGWSTLTGGLVLFRGANGFRPESTLYF